LLTKIRIFSNQIIAGQFHHHSLSSFFVGNYELYIKEQKPLSECKMLVISTPDQRLVDFAQEKKARLQKKCQLIIHRLKNSNSVDKKN
jgi:hypothetical protein